MAVNMLLSIAILLYIFIPWESIIAKSVPIDPDALTRPIVITSNDKKWQLEAKRKAEVSLHILQPGNTPTIIKTLAYFNPRREQWDYQTLPAEANSAAFSPKSQYVVVNWDWAIPKYSPVQLQIINLQTHKSNFLPGFDASRGDDLPTWSKSERYLAISGGYTIRLWDTKHLDTVKLIGPILYRKIAINSAYNLSFVDNDRHLKVSYELIKPNGYPDTARYLNAVFSVPDGKLLSTKLIPIPQQ